MKYGGAILIVFIIGSILANYLNLVETGQSARLQHASSHDRVYEGVQTANKILARSELLDSFHQQLSAFNPEADETLFPDELIAISSQQKSHNVQEMKAGEVAEATPEQTAATQYDLSMIFIADGIRYAVLNNEFVQAGQHLSDGSKITYIGKQRVLLSRRGINETLTLGHLL